MKTLLFSVLILICFDAASQTSSGYIAFSFGDSLNKPIHPEKYKISLAFTDPTDDQWIEVVEIVHYDAKEMLFFVNVAPYFYSTIIEITAEELSSGTITSYEINLKEKIKSPEQFKNLLITRIPISKTSVKIDMPSEEISWQFIPTVKKRIDGTEIEFRDLTFMQNWFY